MLAALLCAASLHAHALHESTAEAEFNPETGKLEVSLRVFASDLELALIRHSERLLSLEKTPAAEMDKAIRDYLATCFQLTTHGSQPIALTWVGRETERATKPGDDDAITLYFELPLPHGLDGCTLKHAVLTECYADQLNLLQLREGKRQTQLRFTRPEPERALALPR